MMLPEPVTIVTTVVGLNEAVQAFIHDLKVSEALLKDIQDLCSRLQKDGATTLPEIQLETLNIHVVDYGQALEEWLRISLRFASRALQQKPGVAVEQLSLMLRPKAFGNFLHAVQGASRNDIRSSVKWHQDNIKLSLSLLNVKLALVQQETLEHVYEAVEDLKQLSSSGSSILALSITHEDRLKDVQSNVSNLSDRLGGLEKILHSISSQGSEASSSAEDHLRSSRPQSVTDAVRDGRATGLPGHRREENPRAYEADETVPSPTTSNPEQEAAGPIEMQMLLEISKEASEIIIRVTHPMIAEYIATRAAWGLLHSQRLALDLEHIYIEQKNQTGSESRVKRIERKFTLAARRLLSLRKSCHYEDLDDILALVDKRLKITQCDVDRWIVIAQGSSRKRQKLDLRFLDFATPSERLKDRITRLNEWIYDAMITSTHLPGLHRLMFEEIETQTRQSVREAEQLNRSNSGISSRFQTSSVRDTSYFKSHDSYTVRHLDNATLARETLKYWLLDMAALPNDEYAASSIGDSEATFRPYQSEAHNLDKDDEDEQMPTQDVPGLLKQPNLPRGWESLVTKILNRNPQTLSYERPAAAASAASKTLAQEALEEYRSEPNGQSWI